jgi:exosortase/archaeosortase family protein
MANDLGARKNTLTDLSSSSSFARIAQDYWLQIRVAIIAILALMIFFQDIYITGSEAIASSFYNYVLVIPFLSGFLIYRARRRLAAVMSLPDDQGQTNLNLGIGVSALAVAAVLYLYGSGTTYALDYHLVALEIFLGASILMLFNRKTLWILTLPLLLFIAAFPSLTEFGLSFWLAISWLTVVPAQWILAHIIGLNVVITLPSVNIPTLTLTTAAGAQYSFEVAVASSGVYSVVGFTLFAAFLGYICRGNLWKKALLFISAYPLLVLINILREVILVSVANIWGMIAFDIFHETSGIVLVFFVTLAVLVIGDRLLKLDFLPPRSQKPSCSLCGQEKKHSYTFCSNCGKFLLSAARRFSTRDAYAIGSLVIVTLILVATLGPAVANANAPTSIPIQSISASNADSLLPQVPGWNLTFNYQDFQVQQELEQDAALIYTYTQQSNINSSTGPMSLYVLIQVSASVHTPEASLIVYPILFGKSGVHVLTDGDVQILSHPYLVGTYFAYQQGSATNAYVYWVTRAVFNFGSYSAVRNVEISIWQNANYLADIGAIPNATDLTGIKQAFLPLAQAIALFWQPVSSNSVVQTLFQRWSVPMLGLAMVPAAAIVAESSLNTRRRKSNETVRSKLLKVKEKSLLESVELAYLDQKNWLGFKTKRPPTVEQIIAVHNARTSERLEPMDAFKELRYLEHLGFVKRDIIADTGDEPIQAWRLRATERTSLGKV